MKKRWNLFKGLNDLSFKSIWYAITDNLWVILLDLLSVNASYFLALMIRFYVNWTFRPIVMSEYLPTFQQFAPWYSIVALIVFAYFRLYNGIWRYAGLNDLNRIIFANFCTLIVQIVGTCLFIKRMPLSYYVIGSILQLAFTFTIRFGYRILTTEIGKLSSRNVPTVNAIVIGLGEIGRQVIQEIRENKKFTIAAIVENSTQGKFFDGIPVIGIEKLFTAIEKQDVQCIFIADQQLGEEKRRKIFAYCEEKKLDIQDYTGALANADETVSLSALLNLVKAKVVLQQGDNEAEYDTGHQAQKELTERYTIESIGCRDNKIYLQVRTNQQVVFVLNNDDTEAFVGYDAWAQRKSKQTSASESSFE